MAKGSSSSLPMLLVLLAIVVGAGTWNYLRNEKLAEAEPRPYRSYSASQLDELRAAYQAEVDRHSARYRQASATQVDVRDGGFLGAQVEEFERVQRISQGKRAIASDYAKNQVRLESVTAEITRRAAQGPPWQRILRQATKFQ